MDKLKPCPYGKQVCPECGGWGMVNIEPYSEHDPTCAKCPTCHGTGEVPEVPEEKEEERDGRS